MEAIFCKEESLLSLMVGGFCENIEF